MPVGFIRQTPILHWWQLPRRHCCCTPRAREAISLISRMAFGPSFKESIRWRLVSTRCGARIGQRGTGILIPSQDWVHAMLG